MVAREDSMEKCNSSMQLTRAADYAVRVMVYLARIPRDHRALLPAITAATSAPESFLSKVLQALTRARLITSRRGPAGGFQISSRGRQASMREVIEAIDGPMHLNVCLTDKRSCPRKDWCPAHPVWVTAQEALLNVLNTALVSDLASGKYTGLPNLIDHKTGTSR
jgi:Rrf2 family protein